MPHLRFDHSAALGALADLPRLAQVLRQALLDTGLFPPGGIRVRGYAAGCEAVADGGEGWLFLDIDLRIGAGRSAEDRKRVAAILYAAARAELEPQLAGRPCALSLELREIDPAFSLKGWNGIHAALGGAG